MKLDSKFSLQTTDLTFLLFCKVFLCFQDEEESYLQKADRLNSLMNAVTDKVRGGGASHVHQVSHKEPENIEGQNGRSAVIIIDYLSIISTVLIIDY